MHKHFLILFLLPLALFGQEANFSARPGSKKSAPVPEELPNPFQGAPVAQSANERYDERGSLIPEPEGMKLLQDYLRSNPPSALAWSDNPDLRSVLIGESVIRIGGSISADVVPFGPSFRLADIQRNRITFVSNLDPDYRVVQDVQTREPIRPADKKQRRKAK